MAQLHDVNLLKTQAFINGQWLDADDASVFEVTNPADNSVIAHVPKMGANETRKALHAAQVAQKLWQQKTAKERADILHKWYQLIMDNQQDLAVIMTLEQGKPLAESRGEIAYAASFIQWFAEQARRINGETIPAHQSDKRILVEKQPIGVCVAITPWNFPAAMITRKVAPALAAGCAAVVKPAEQTPLSALALAELAKRAGLPAGLYNVVTGDAKAIGGEMTSSDITRHLSFTGSTEVGKILMRQCSDKLIKVALELGGNAPFIVFDDADLDAAVEGAIASKYRNSGQTCVCSNRIYVQSGVYDAFMEKLKQAVLQLQVGAGFTEGVNIGPLIDADAVTKVSSHIDDAISKGASVVSGGKPHELGGTFFQPTILANVTQSMLVAKEETFGPLAPVFRFDDEQQVVDFANDTEYGLACYFYTRDYARIFRVSQQLEYGMVGINTGLISTEVAPFGGIKQSGFGREGSVHGIEEYLEMKYLCIGGIN